MLQVRQRRSLLSKIWCWCFWLRRQLTGFNASQGNLQAFPQWPGDQYKLLPNLCILRLASNEVASLASHWWKRNSETPRMCGHYHKIHKTIWPYIIYPHSTRSLSDIWSTLLASRLSCFHLHDLWKQHAWTCQTNPDSRWCRNDLKYHSSLITFLTTTHKSPSIPSISKYSIDCQGRGRPSRIRSVTHLSGQLGLFSLQLLFTLDLSQKGSRGEINGTAEIHVLFFKLWEESTIPTRCHLLWLLWSAPSIFNHANMDKHAELIFPSATDCHPPEGAPVFDMPRSDAKAIWIHEASELHLILWDLWILWFAPWCSIVDSPPGRCEIQRSLEWHSSTDSVFRVISGDWLHGFAPEVIHRLVASMSRLFPFYSGRWLIAAVVFVSDFRVGRLQC